MSVQRSTQRRSRTARAGFTFIEVMIVILLAGIVGTVAIPQFSRYTSMRGATNARDAFIATAGQARAAAIQLGEEVRLEVEPPVTVRVRVPRNDSTITLLDYEGGNIRGRVIGAAAFNVCYVARGFARSGAGCVDPPVEVGFVSPQGRDTSWARVNLGQVQRR